MTTRRSSGGARQHGHASDPVYVAAQGIQGTIVTKKAGILTSPRARSLVFFLQGLSLPELAGNSNPGGLKKWVAEFLKEFAERIGTPSMHRFGMKPGQIYKVDQACVVREELMRDKRGWYEEKFPLVGDTVTDLTTYEETPIRHGKASYPAADFQRFCALLASEGLAEFIISLCTDPRMIVSAPGEATTEALVSECEIGEEWPELLGENFKVPSLPYFHDIMGALFEFQARFGKRVEESFAETSIAREIFDTLDAGLRLRRIVMVNGIDGIGKSEAVRSWCARHLGEVRYVGLTGINNKTNFFRSIASALGLPAGESLNSGERQGRVEAMLQRSGLMLCIDEAHFMFKNSERSRATPEQIDWIDTALCNRGVSAALICTPQFITSMQQVQKRSGWNSGQFRRRLKRLTMLPDRPTKADLECVARKRLPKASSSVIKHLVGFAGGQQRHHLDTLNDAINEAEVIAGSLDKIAFCHVESVTRGVLTQTALAKAQAFAVLDAKPGKPGRFASGN